MAPLPVGWYHVSLSFCFLMKKKKVLNTLSEVFDRNLLALSILCPFLFFTIGWPDGAFFLSLESKSPMTRISFASSEHSVRA